MFDYHRLQSTVSAVHSKQMFFIGGVAKSGTTWLQILLDLHPNITCKGEGHFPNTFAPLLKGVLDMHNIYPRRILQSSKRSKDTPGIRKSIIYIY
jgi:hypothetical protein